MPLVFKAGNETKIAQERRGKLLGLARLAGLPMGASCGGAGTCGSCTVFLEQGRFELFGQTVEIEAGDRREVLACETVYLGGDAEVTVPRVAAVVDEGARIETDVLLPTHASRPAVRVVDVRLAAAQHESSTSLCERLAGALGLAGVDPDIAATLPADASSAPLSVSATLAFADGQERLIDLRMESSGRPPLALAVDIGTSTVAVALLDPATGRILDRAARFNQQMLRGDDVASRITHSMEPDGVKVLRELVTGHTINPMIAELCDRQSCDPEDIGAVAICGNTVMAHLFLGLPPAGIGTWPFMPVARAFPTVSAQTAGLSCHPRATVYVAPAIAGYVGGDIVADLAVAGFGQRPGVELLIDIGTNGEMVLAENGALFACATAAGPAFEGAGLVHGCRAVRGAIERIDLDAAGRLNCATIGGAPAIGLCGSAAIDFIACGCEAGLINEFGRYDLDLLRRMGRYVSFALRGHSTHACVLADASESGTGAAIVVTEADIAQVLKAKAAIYAGIKTLLQGRGRAARAIDRLILAGGFARHIRLERAIRIGLLPDVPVATVEVIGNGSLAGAVLALVDTSSRRAFVELMNRPAVVELNLAPDFAGHFAEALAIPHLDPTEFPSLTAQERST